jgi:hypothetical protein
MSNVGILKEIQMIQNQYAELPTHVPDEYKVIKYLSVRSFLIVSQLKEHIHVIGPNDNRFLIGLKYSASSITFGLWGFPWGLILTTVAVILDTFGGEDITLEVKEGKLSTFKLVIDILGKSILLSILIFLIYMFIWG